MLNIGYGVNVWSNGLQTGHLDGIGVYSRELYTAMRLLPQDQFKLSPMGVGALTTPIEGELPQIIAEHYLRHLLKYSFLRKRLTLQGLSSKPDLFHAPDHHISALQEVPVVASVMDLIPFLHPEWVSGRLRQLKNWLFKSMIVSAQHWITISEHSKRDMVKHLGLNPNQISVTPLGVNPCYFEHLPEAECEAVLKKYELQAGFFLFVGTLQPRKNLETVLAAHAALPLSVQKAHPVVIVGNAGWKVETLMSRIERQVRAGTVKWLKYIPQREVQALLKTARALMYISLYEGFGLPVLEAFAAGCPVIGSNTTSVPEVAGDAAPLVHPQDTQAVTEMMRQMLEDDVWREGFIEKGSARAKTFTWQRCALETLKAYDRCLGRVNSN